MNPLSLVLHYPTRFFVTGRFLSIPQSIRLSDGDGGWPLCRCHAQAPPAETKSPLECTDRDSQISPRGAPQIGVNQ